MSYNRQVVPHKNLTPIYISKNKMSVHRLSIYLDYTLHSSYLKHHHNKDLFIINQTLALDVFSLLKCNDLIMFNQLCRVKYYFYIWYDNLTLI